MRFPKGCWTCTARKIQCDRALPTCLNCSRAHRRCEGYGKRLSWPRNGDKKRTLVGANAPPGVISLSQPPTDLYFLNTTWHDIQLYHHLSLQTRSLHLTQYSPDLWRQPQLQVGHVDLVYHFYNSAYLSLVTFLGTTSQLRDVLVRMAVSHDTSPGLALFSALLAFSSLHRDGLCHQAVELKTSALHFLSASVKDGPLAPTEAAKHVAASMLLGSFETLLPSESSGEWLCHVWGAMDMIQASTLKDQSSGGDFGPLLDWAHYHEVVSRFAVHHWRHQSLALKTPGGNTAEPHNPLQYSSLARQRPASPSPNPTYAILNLLSELCDTLLDPWDPRSRNSEYQSRLKALEQKIESVPLESGSTKSTADAALVVELHQVATRIFLVRATQSPWESPTGLDALIESAFTGPIRSCTCEHFFPLFILACEARREEHRVAILNLIDRVERDTRLRSIQGLKNAIHAIWVQYDLRADNDVLDNYLGIMSAVISSGSAVPSLV